MNKTCKSLVFLLLEWFTVSLLLAACGGAADQTGLDAVARTGHWMSVLQPVQDASPQVTVVDLATGYPWPPLTDADTFRRPVTIFSPSGKYLLYRGGEMWQLMEISSQYKWPVASTSMYVEFLHDDEVLIINNEGTAYQISQMVPGQEQPSTIISQGRYIFQSQAQGLSTVSASSFAGNAPSQAFCPSAPVVARDTHVIVDTDWAVWVFAEGTDIHRKQNPALEDLFRTHEAKQKAFALQQIQATPENANMGEDQKAAYLDYIARWGITGLVSPDGERLLILTATSITNELKKYSLNLIDLEKKQRIPLSDESDWAPEFLFSPDGNQIIYESNDQGDRAWYLRTLDGSNPIRLSLQGVETLCWH